MPLTLVNKSTYNVM